MTKAKVAKGVLLAVVLLGIFVSIGFKRYQLKVRGRYTIGVTTGRDGKFIKYKFQVSGIEYEGEGAVLKYSPIEREGRYLVKFLPSDDVSMSEILWEEPVPESLLKAPEEGWTEIPW